MVSYIGGGGCTGNPPLLDTWKLWCDNFLASSQAPHICIHNNTCTWVAKNRKGLGSIHHVNGVRWTWGGRRGVGPNYQTMHWIIRSSALSQVWIPDLIMIETTAPSPPYVHLTSTHVMNAPRPSPVFCSRVLLWTQTEDKNGRGLKTRIIISSTATKENIIAKFDNSCP